MIPPALNPSVTLLMAIHCHQPVGNFGFVFEEAYAKAYEPFLRTLERHPGVRLSLHYSGSLLDWLREHQPAFLARVRALVAKGQVELLASGYYEPILPMIPEADRQGQIAQMRSALHRHFRTDAAGLWLTERVWEPELPQTLAHAGIRYTMVDTNQFASARAWLPAFLQLDDEGFWDVMDCYTTEYAGSSVVVFPASKRLRYWMPFQPVSRTIEFFKRVRRDEPVAMTFADDGEKFGLWPKTFQWVYEEGWLDQFFGALEREASWLQTATFQDYLEAAKPKSTVYLPCGSYEEMLEWSGGYFRNFFTKYPEAHAMQQKMLRVSRQLQAVRSSEFGVRSVKAGRGRLGNTSPLAPRPSPLLVKATQELYQAQCNCAYWHGVFGGLYLSHLRRAVYAHLIEAERLTRQLSRAKASGISVETDGAGRATIRLRNGAMGVLVNPAEGGAITEWDVVKPRLNLLDTFSRRAEPYHEKLRARSATSAVSSGGSTPASIHDLLSVKEENLTAHLVYDDHRRSAFLDYALQSLPTLQEVVRGAWGERWLWRGGMSEWDRADRGARSLQTILSRGVPGGRVRKTIRLGTRDATLECDYELEGIHVPVIGLEFNVSLRDERYLQQPQTHTQISQFTIQEPGVGVSLHLSLDPPATLFHFPVETISESEEGMERTYQGLCLLCCWALGERTRAWAGRLRWAVETR